MPPATRTTRRSLRARRATSPPIEALDAKNSTQSTSESILRHPSTSGSDGDQVDHQQKKSSSAKSNRSVTFSLGENQSSPSPSVSDASLSVKGNVTNAAALSVRAKRSKRRQAKIEKDPAKKVTGKKSTSSKRSVESSMKKEFVKSHSSSNNSTTIKKKGAGGKDEEVVKVKLNTGTLYLYKGLHRRAVFVRRV